MPPKVVPETVVFIERKTHHEGQEESVKERFKLAGADLELLLS